MLSRRSTVWSTVLVLVSVLLSLFASAAPAGAAGPVVVYDSIPTPLPGNYPSLAFEANGISGFGGRRPTGGRTTDAGYGHGWHEHVGADHRRSRPIPILARGPIRPAGTTPSR